MTVAPWSTSGRCAAAGTGASAIARQSQPQGDLQRDIVHLRDSSSETFFDGSLQCPVPAQRYSFQEIGQALTPRKAVMAAGRPADFECVDNGKRDLS